MRRLVGLIALLALIYGAWWLTQNDFDLRKVPILGDVINEIRGPGCPGSAGYRAQFRHCPGRADR
jgi:hypothetical protein